MENTRPASTSAPIFGVVIAGFCSFLGFYATQPLLPLFARIFHATKVSVSLTITLSTLGVAVAAPVVGRIADHAGRKRVIVTAAFLVAVFTLLAATSSGLKELILWRLVLGLVTPGVFAITIAYVNDEWPPGEVAHGVGAYVTGTIIGGFSGRMVAGLVAAHMNWRWAFVLLGLLNAAGALAVWVCLPKESRFVRTAHHHSHLNAVLDHVKNPRLLATYAVGFCVLFSLVATFTYVTFYLAAPPFHLSPAALGSIFVVYLVGTVITPVSSRYIDRYGYRNSVATSVVTGIAGVLLTLTHDLWIVMVGLCICSCGVFIANASSSSYIGKAAKHNRALAVGLYVTFYYAGGSAGGVLPGYFWALGGWPACVALIVGAQALTVAIAMVYWSE